jgi:hypothetical protein
MVHFCNDTSGKDVIAEVEVMVVVEAVTEILTHVYEGGAIGKPICAMSLVVVVGDIVAAARDDSAPCLK